MYGAILGDMIGSPFEFDRGKKTKEFELFSKGAGFTDDTVMTLAVAVALMNLDKDAPLVQIREQIVRCMRYFGRKYLDAGYGGNFGRWLRTRDEHPKAYGSYGNGSAMRVSSVGWMYDTIGRTREVARATADVTHNHPEGIKGAEAVASAIFLARTGSSKDEIKEYVVRNFHYNLDRTCDEIRPFYHHVESCQETVPEAITAFLEGTAFEDVIRTAVSLGGDCDTLTAIAGSIAEAYYGVPGSLRVECRKRLLKELMGVLLQFWERLGEDSRDVTDPFLEENRWIEKAIQKFHKETTKENLVLVLEIIQRRMHEDGHLLIPVEAPKAALDMIDPAHVQVGDVVQAKENLHFVMRQIITQDGKHWMAAFTGNQEMLKVENTHIISICIDQYLEDVLEMENVEGVILNPWEQSLLMDKKLIQAIFDADRQEER